jgi:hypothetical protein
MIVQRREARRVAASSNNAVAADWNAPLKVLKSGNISAGAFQPLNRQRWAA